MATRVIACLGNPGSEYSTTRHNVAWWLADRLAEVWGLGRFKREGEAGVASGRYGASQVRVLKPLTYMNRSGRVLTPYLRRDGFDPSTDLLVVVDEVALDAGRARFRPSGSAGGHNGLKSIEAALGTREYPRLRIGVGPKPPAADLSDWVLSPVPRADRQLILDLMPDLVDCVGVWVEQGIEEAMNRCNGLGRATPEED